MRDSFSCRCSHLALLSADQVPRLTKLRIDQKQQSRQENRANMSAHRRAVVPTQINRLSGYGGLLAMERTSREIAARIRLTLPRRCRVRSSCRGRVTPRLGTALCRAARHQRAQIRLP